VVVVYCDSTIPIYLLDTVGPFNVRAAARTAAMRAAGDVAAFSDLTRLECRLKPIRLGATKALADFDAFFLRPDVRFIPITTAAFDRATQIRAAHTFKLGHSLNLAAATESHCDRFLTNDARLSAFTDIPVEVLP
jgi:predicted nucleic acid-binding protein